MKSNRLAEAKRAVSWTQRLAPLLVVVGLIAVVAQITGPAFAAAPAAAAGDKDAAKININTATSEQLQDLPGVGPALAQRILDYRKENGAFKKVEELMNVKGIGEKSFAKLKDRITVGS